MVWEMITPEQSKALSTDNHYTQELEDKIDQAITNCSIRCQWPAEIGIGAFPTRIVELIAQKYQLAGWIVTWKYGLIISHQ